ncbi:MAG: hypothetical protein PW788_13555 [Micavibrio sp.]|nr:hypothetical protein [Micavibrio sp.]
MELLDYDADEDVVTVEIAVGALLDIQQLIKAAGGTGKPLSPEDLKGLTADFSGLMDDIKREQDLA